MNKIVLISQQRQGSTLATTLLKSHSLVHSDDELFKYSDLQKIFPAWILPWVLRFPDWYLRYKEFKCQQPNYVFKFMVNQVPHPRAFVHRMVKRGYKVISVYREDAIGIALSRCIAEQTKIWFVRSLDRRTQEKVNIPPNDLLNALADVSRYYRLQERVLEGIDHWSIHYENELCENDQFEAFSKKICNYASLPFEQLTTRSLPTDERSDAERIENFDELMDMLKTSTWAPYLSKYRGNRRG